MWAYIDHVGSCLGGIVRDQTVGDHRRESPMDLNRLGSGGVRTSGPNHRYRLGRPPVTLTPKNGEG